MYARNQVWLLAPSVIRQVYDRAKADEKPINRAPREVKAAAAKYATGLMGEARASGYSGVAVVPVCGILSQRGDCWFFGSSTEDLTATLRTLADMPSVSAIVLDCDSPGGLVQGIPELADVIDEVTASKPVVAVVNSLCASAAYWLAAQCSEVICTSSGEAGGIGVYAVHTEFSEADKKAGIANTIISAGPFKAEGNDMQPLSSEGAAFMQETVNKTYIMFLQAVARGRGVSVKAVAADFGQGRVLLADDAEDAGLVDRVATLEEVVSDLASKGASDSRQRAMTASNRAKMRADWEREKREAAKLIRSCQALQERRARA